VGFDISQLFGSGQSRVAKLEATRRQLEEEAKALRKQNRDLIASTQTVPTLEQASRLAGINSEVQRDLTGNLVDGTMALQPAYEAKTGREIRRDTSAVQARSNADIAFEDALARNKGALLGQLGDIEKGKLNWITGEGKSLIGSLGDERLRLTEAMYDRESQITPRDLLGMVGPLAAAALAFA
jgi:hypothetical protein